MEQMKLFEEIYDVVSPEDEMFEKALLRGSGFEGGKDRIYSFSITNPSIKDFSKFLKSEYGVGGYGLCGVVPGNVHSERHDENGIQFRWIDNKNLEEKYREFSWPQIAKIIISMINREIYK